MLSLQCLGAACATGEGTLIATLARKNRQTVVILISLVLILETETKTWGLVFREYRLGLSLFVSNRDSAFRRRESISHPETLRDNFLSPGCSEKRPLLP